MAATVDSTKEQLSIPEILIKGIQNNPVKGLTPTAMIASLVKEGSMPNTKVTQYGNTVFFTHYGTGDNSDLVVDRAINVDVARNFIANGNRHFRNLYEEGIRRYVTQFDQRSFAVAFKQLEKRPVTSEQKIYILDTPKGETQVRMILGGELL